MFRLSRVRSTVRRVGRGDAFEVPQGTDLREITRRLAPAPATHHASVLVRTGAGLGLRRYAGLVAERVTGPDGGSGWDRLSVPFGQLNILVEEVLSYGPDAYLEEPAEAREAVVRRLERALELAGEESA
jgi:proteasome accessory factor B